METISRRKFIQLGTLAGSFLGIGFEGQAHGKEKLIATLFSDPSAISLNQFISIGTDNSIILFNHRPEMGQGTFLSVPMILAEELEVEIDKIEVKPSAADANLYGSQMVVGSRSIQSEFDKLRKMGATAREMLRQAAANTWKIDLSQCVAKKGTIVSATGSVLKYGELVQEAAKLSPPANPSLKSRSEFSVIGTAATRKDIPVKTNGAAKFGIDIMVPGMLYASVQHSSVFKGKVKSINEEEVLKMPGVRKVLKTSRQVYGLVLEGVA